MRSLHYWDPVCKAQTTPANKNLYLWKGDVLKAKEGVACLVARIDCPEHPGRSWTEIHRRHGWGIAYKDSTAPSGKRIWSGETETLTFKHIDVWLEDADYGLTLQRAMR